MATLRDITRELRALRRQTTATGSAALIVQVDPADRAKFEAQCQRAGERLGLTVKTRYQRGELAVWIED